MGSGGELLTDVTRRGLRRIDFRHQGWNHYLVERIAALLRGGLMLFSPFLRIHSSFIIGSLLLRIRNP
jgi:hypothetical protein